MKTNTTNRLIRMLATHQRIKEGQGNVFTKYAASQIIAHEDDDYDEEIEDGHDGVLKTFSLEYATIADWIEKYDSGEEVISFQLTDIGPEYERATQYLMFGLLKYLQSNNISTSIFEIGKNVMDDNTTKTMDAIHNHVVKLGAKFGTPFTDHQLAIAKSAITAMGTIRMMDEHSKDSSLVLVANPLHPSHQSSDKMSATG